MGEYNINGLAIPLFLVFMVIEYLYLRLTGRYMHRFNDNVTSISMGLCLLVSDALLKAYTFAVFIVIWDQYRVVDFDSASLVTWVVFFVGVDFCYYWFHRVAHEVNFLWGAHVGHHQSEEYNLTTALRQSAFQYAFSWLFYLPLALFGCPPEVFLLQFVVLKLYQFWLHTQIIGQIPWLEGIFSTPSSHRVHHAKNPIYIDRNYGGTLVIWDRMFGTWQAELASEKCHYGTTRALDTLDPIKANLQHWSMLAKDSVATANWQDKIKLWFQPTGWRPKDCQLKGQELNSAFDSGTHSELQKLGCANRKKFDPQTSTKVKAYVALSMLAIFVLSTMFLFLSPTLSSLYLATGVVVIVGGVFIANQFLENNFRNWFVELIRVPLMVWFMGVLWLTPSSTTVVDSILVEKSPVEALDYASSVGLWPEWHPQSSKVYVESQAPLIEGEIFEEDIVTPIGKNHLFWNVKESLKGNVWIAHARNQDNGANIQLEYRVKGQGEHAIFERTLHYQLPHFAFLVFNSLYFQRQVEAKSESAMFRLKQAIEAS